jgi:transcription elongation factor Elf1
MCSQYWTLKDIEFTCPFCGEGSVVELQTHFMGEIGSCSNYYKLFERVPELRNMTISLEDDFTVICPKCRNLFDCGAEIKDGVVVSTSVVEDYECSCGDVFKLPKDMWAHRREVHANR